MVGTLALCPPYDLFDVSDLILRSCVAASRRMNGTSGASWFETALRASSPSGVRYLRSPRLTHRRQHDVGRPGAWRLVAGRHDLVDFGESFDLFPPQLGIGEHLAQLLRQRFRRAILLQE